jgi:hypothetical protein
VANNSAKRWPIAAGLGLIVAVVLGLFADLLFRAEPPVLSAVGGDMWREFIFWRDFGFTQLRQGNLALWNPYVYCGIPFFGGFQSALLYPPNWLYMVLPLAVAVNVGVALHFALSGVLMFAWAGHRGLGVPARTLAAILFTFCGPVYMHLHAGHVMMLCPVAWAPLVMLAVDKLFDEGRLLRWSLVGAAAVAMQILAGHPQTVYYTAIAAVLYAALRAMALRKELRADKMRAAGVGCGLAGMFIGAAAVTAVQLLTGIAAAGESVRGPGVPKSFAAMFAFPPENFLTLLAPGFFGDILNQEYWGRCYLWEMCAFLSVSGLFLALYGALDGQRRARRLLGAMSLICVLLALGSHTPLFDLLYALVPGYDKFRGNAKFMFLAAMFAALLAGVGLDRMLTRHRTDPSSRRRLVCVGWSALAVGACLLGAAVVVHSQATPTTLATAWREFMRGRLLTNESYLPRAAYEDVHFVARAAHFAARSLLLAGGTGIVLSLLWFWSVRRPKLGYAVAVLACAEILVFARSQRVTFELETTRLPPELESYFAAHHDDGRIYWPGGNDNQTMIYERGTLWGDDPGVPLRYGQFLTWTQGGDPNLASQYLEFRRYDPLYAMLRAQYFLLAKERSSVPGRPAVEAGGWRLYELAGALPRALLIEDFSVIPDRDAAFAAMRDPEFDPHTKVILERAPTAKMEINPGHEAPGRVSVAAISTDELLVEAELARPAILLLTDAYHSGWRAEPADESAQGSYEIIPANYVLQAIPLQAGKHRIRLEYLPAPFVVGKWISIVSLVAYCAAWVYLWRKGRGHA